MEARIEKVVSLEGEGWPQCIICLGNSNMMELQKNSMVCDKCPICRSVPIRPAVKARLWERKSGIGTLSPYQEYQWRSE